MNANTPFNTPKEYYLVHRIFDAVTTEYFAEIFGLQAILLRFAIRKRVVVVGNLRLR